MKAFSASDDLDVVQWFFDLQPVTKGLNWPIHVDGLVTAKQRLDTLLADSDSSAADVLAAYQKIDGALGPSVMTALLEDDEAFPEVNRSGQPTPPAGGKVTLFVDHAGKRVMAETTKVWGMPVKFTLN